MDTPPDSSTGGSLGNGSATPEWCDGPTVDAGQALGRSASDASTSERVARADHVDDPPCWGRTRRDPGSGYANGSYALRPEAISEFSANNASAIASCESSVDRCQP